MPSPRAAEARITGTRQSSSRSNRVSAPSTSLFARLRRLAHIGLGDDDDIGQLHYAGLHELQAVARTRLDAENDAVDGEGNIGLRLADADAFDQHPVEQGAHQGGRRDRLVGQAAEPVARCHGADENALIFRVGRHARAVAEKRAAGAPRRRIDRDHAHRLAAPAPVAQQRVGERRFADAGRPGQARRMGAGLRECGVEQAGQFGRSLMGFDQRQRPRKPALAAGGDGWRSGKGARMDLASMRDGSS